MLSAAISSRQFSNLVLCSLALFLMASLAFAAEECPACKDFLGRPPAKLMMSVDPDTHLADIVVYYDNTSVTPSRQPVNESIIIVELTNSSGYRALYKTYTDADGKAQFDFTQWDKACVDIKALYCPFCDLPGNDCGFAQCIAFAKIHNESTYYSNIHVDITNASMIPVWGSASVPSPLNPNLYFPDYATVSYCAPPSTGVATPALCFPLIIIFSLLSGALYMTGRNPFAAFNIGQGHVGRHIRYQARGRGFSMNIASVATAVSSAVKAGKGPKDKEGKAEKNADGTNKTRWQAMKEEARATGGPLKALGGPLVSGSRSSMALDKHRQATALSQGKGIGSKEYRAAMDSLSHPTGSASATQGGAPNLTTRGGPGGPQQITGGGSGGGFRASDLRKADGKGIDFKAFAMMMFSGTAIGRIADSYATMQGGNIKGGNTLMERFLEGDKGKAAVRAEDDKAVIAMINKQGGFPVTLPNGQVGILQPGSSTPDRNGNITLVFKVMPEVGASVMKGDMTPKTVTVIINVDKKGPVATDQVMVRIMTPEKLDAKGNVIQESVAKEYPVLAKVDRSGQPILDDKGRPMLYINREVDGKIIQVPVIQEGKSLSIAGLPGQPNQPLMITSGIPENSTGFNSFMVKNDKLVNVEPTVKIDSVVTTFSVAGSAGEVKVTSVPGGGSTVVQPAGVNFPDSAIIQSAEKIATKTLGVSSLADKDNAGNLMISQREAMNNLQNIIDSYHHNNVAIQNEKGDEWKKEEIKARAELMRDPSAMAAVKKAEQDIAGDMIGAKGVNFDPNAAQSLSAEETKGKTFARSNTEALYDVVSATSPSVFGDSEKRAKFGEELAEKAGVSPSQGFVIALAVENMTSKSTEALKAMNPEEVAGVMQPIVDQARKNGMISDTDASKLMNPGSLKQMATSISVEASSVGDGLGSLPKSNVMQVPIASLLSLRSETTETVGSSTGLPRYEVPLTAACERAGVPVPPALVKLNSEREDLTTAQAAAEQASSAAKTGTITAGTMERLEVITSRHDDFMRTGFAEEAPKLPKDAITSLNTADSERGQLARAQGAIISATSDIDPNGHLSLETALTRKMDRLKDEYQKALEVPEMADFAAASRIAHEAEGLSRAVGDDKGATSWGYLGAAPTSLLQDELAGKFNPSEKQMKEIEKDKPPEDQRLKQIDQITQANREDAYKRSIYREDVSPKSDAIPSGEDVANRATYKMDYLADDIGKQESKAEKIVTEKADQTKIAKGSDKGPDKKA